ncbi:hypothetical protein L208DRAFT_1382540 [Tricholoma matsutake]|nr:hypothetical protein L208DRAFT_1382540 [Tricholoma matsutake 945]
MYRQDKDSTYHITINLQHHIKHVLYVDVCMPLEALQMIQEQAEWSTPATMATKIQSIYPQVTTMQIHAAWRKLSQQYWHHDKMQLPSAKKLLAKYGDDVDIFELEKLLRLGWMQHAMAEYDFIKPDFIPAGMRVDINDYEGGTLDNELSHLVDGQ